MPESSKNLYITDVTNITEKIIDAEIFLELLS